MQMSPFRRSDSKDTMFPFDTTLGGKGTYIPEAATFCHEGGYYAVPSNKPLLRAKARWFCQRKAWGNYSLGSDKRIYP